MVSKKDEIKQQLEQLYQEAITMSKEIDAGKRLTLQKYQVWYSKSIAVIKQLLPERLHEFTEYYKLDKRKDISVVTYTISDYFMGISVSRGGVELFSSNEVFQTKFAHQVTILGSALSRIDYILTDIKGVLEAELFDNELEGANQLLKAGHVRPAGTLAGVLLEKHLANVCNYHGLKISKKNPTLADLNEALKNGDVIDVPNWRWIQRLGDIRNLCAHAKDREPTKDEVFELVNGVDKAIKTIF
ncbi:Hypothetical protein DPCES_5415 [Desulfitobacterium hafniense]|uniref:DUF4145 domain-containing protein n=1 Tax=Desulfitobacterium hafniense TaxID=49338 RepID=A0A098AV05_DESHA|nr:hypothetical protein [Desulfitobacterium hafniense]CDV96413.1 Hypothetical protein DPCES_5415 [Desulfitobacterium hafniense]